MGLTKDLGALPRVLTVSGSNVGVGVTSPAEKLSVASTDEYLFSWIRTGNSKKWAFGADSAGTYISNRTDSNIPLYITNAGNVGIGTLSPSSKFQVKTGTGATLNTTFLGTNQLELSNYSVTDGYRELASIGSILSFYTGTAGGGSATERMRITSGGNLLLRTTTDSGYQCTINSTAGNLMYFTLGSGNVQMFMGSNSDFYISTANNNGVKLAVGAQSWSAYSDIRLKNITGEIENALEDVNTLSAARFTLKSDTTNKPRVGLIAQEVQKILPEVIDVEEDGILSVRYTELVPLLVGAIKELTARLETLENK